MSIKRWYLWIVTFLAFITYSFVANVLGAALPSIGEEFHLQEGPLGLIASLFALGGFSSVLGGYLSDRVGRALVSSLSFVTLSLGALAMGTSSSLILLAVALITMGVAAGFFEAAANALVATSYNDVRGRAVNLLHIAWNIGSSMAPPATALLITITGTWRSSYILCVPLTAAVAYLLYRARGREARVLRENPVTIGYLLREVVKVFPIALVSFFILALELGVSYWLPSIMIRMGFTLIEGTTVVSVFWAMMGVGRLILGPLSDRMGYRRTIVVCGTVTSLALASTPLLPTFIVLLLAYAAAGFFSGPVYPTNIAWVNSLNPVLGGSLTGLLFVLGTSGIFVATSAIGYAIQLIGAWLSQLAFIVLAVLMTLNAFLARTSE